MRYLVADVIFPDGETLYAVYDSKEEKLFPCICFMKDSIEELIASEDWETLSTSNDSEDPEEATFNVLAGEGMDSNVFGNVQACRLAQTILGPEDLLRG